MLVFDNYEEAINAANDNYSSSEQYQYVQRDIPFRSTGVPTYNLYSSAEAYSEAKEQDYDTIEDWAENEDLIYTTNPDIAECMLSEPTDEEIDYMLDDYRCTHKHDIGGMKGVLAEFNIKLSGIDFDTDEIRGLLAPHAQFDETDDVWEDILPQIEKPSFWYEWQGEVIADQLRLFVECLQEDKSLPLREEWTQAGRSGGYLVLSLEYPSTYADLDALVVACADIERRIDVAKKYVESGEFWVEEFRAILEGLLPNPPKVEPSATVWAVCKFNKVPTQTPDGEEWNEASELYSICSTRELALTEGTRLLDENGGRWYIDQYRLDQPYSDNNKSHWEWVSPF